jgi:hypothetical protein
MVNPQHHDASIIIPEARTYVFVFLVDTCSVLGSSGERDARQGVSDVY